MKKILFLFAFVAIGFISQAQTSLKSQYGNTLDSAVNTTAKYLTLANPVGTYYKIASIAVGVTEVSGTTGGTITCESSLDGTVWYNVYLSTDSSYSFTPADVTTLQGFRFKIYGWGDRYLRIKYTPTGTMSAAFTAKASFFN